MAVNGSIHIHASVKKQKTFLKTSYASHPFKVMNITEDKTGHELRLMLMSSSPGVLDGDEYSFKIKLDKGSVLHLQTQSYQRLFPMKKGASQNMQVLMEEGSYFSYLPHPSVPHQNAQFIAKNQILLSENCTLIWGEVLTCGRKLNGEVFLFSQYHNCTDIFFKNRLVIKENLMVRPSAMNMLALGQLEGFTHQASFIFLHPNVNNDEAKQQCEDLLSVEDNIEFGITSTPIDGIMVRLLGYKAEQLHAALVRLGIHLSKMTSSHQNIKPVAAYAE